MPILLGDIVLPGDMEWPNRVVGWRIGQDVQTTATGSIVVQEGTRQGGRPITLQSGSGSGSQGQEFWGVVDYSVLLELEAAVNAGGSYVLSIPNDTGPPQTFNVIFDQSDPITSSPVDHVVPPVDGDWYALTLKFLVVD